MKKYYFGYYNQFGIARPQKWEEINGVVTGSLHALVGERYEITRAQYLRTRLEKLRHKFPYKELSPLQ